MPEQFLAIADADKIHDYVFSPHELRLIKGGSALQKHMNQTILKQAVADSGGDCISANGGTVVARFRRVGQAEGFCKSAERSYREHTAVATVSTAWAAYADGQWVPARDELKARLESAKQARRKWQFSGSSPFWTTCQSCGLYPAAHAYYAGPDKRWICQACHLRKKGSPSSAPNSPETFEDIGKSASPENYMALVYVDLDRLGKYMDHFGATEAAWSELSQKVDNAIQSSVSAGCEKLDPKAKFQVLLAGGDDAIVALPADRVFRFLEAFESSFKACDLPSDTEMKASYSAGVVMAHSHYPIFEFRRLAEELLRSAKRIDFGNGKDSKPNSIDFEILTASMTDSIVAARDRVAERTMGPRRTAKPYTIQELLGLEKRVRELKKAGVPSSRVRSLYSIVYQGEMQADLDYLYLLSRLDTGQRNTMREVVGPQLFKAGPKDGRVTEAADLVEMWDFVHDA